MPQCRLSILRNCNVFCHYCLNVPVDFKVVQCRLSNLRNSPVNLSNLRVKGPGGGGGGGGGGSIGRWVGGWGGTKVCGWVG